MKHKLLVVLMVIALLGVVPMLAAAQGEGIESVCLVTDIGDVDDGTFNQFAFEGMNLAVDDFGLDSTYVVSKSQTDLEYRANIQTCLDSGYDAIVTVGFMITDTTHAAAEANPDVYFIGVDQFFAEPLPNLVGIQYREDQAGFLVGAMAALMTESGTIAGVYGVAIPPVVKFRNGYEQGAKYINPDINVLGVYIDSFDDSAGGGAAAEQMIGEGADVVFGAGGKTGSGGIRFAAQEGVYGIGVDQDEYFTTFQGGESPDAEYLISSAIKRVDVGVYNMLELLVNGEPLPEGSIYILSVDNDGVGFAEAHDSDVPEEVTEQVQEIYEGLKDGSIETGVDPLSGELLSEMDMATEEANS